MVKPYYIKGVQRQLFAGALQKWCSWNFSKIHRKTTVLESLFSKVAGLKRLHRKCFSMIFAIFLRKPYNKTLYTIK